MLMKMPVFLTATFPGGTLTCLGKAQVNRPVTTLRVVAGSGSFKGATGVCEARPAPKNQYGADSVNVYRLQIPG